MASTSNKLTIGLPPRYPRPIGSLMMNQIQSSSSSSTNLNNVELPTNMNTYFDMATPPLYEADNHLYPSAALNRIINELAAEISMVPQGVLGDPSNNGIKDIIVISDDDDDDDVIPSLVDLTNNTEQIDNELNHEIDPNMDLKKKKRILSNRMSAQKYRTRKVEYVAQLERRVKALKTEVAFLISQMSKYELKFCELVIENVKMRQRIVALTILRQSQEVRSVILTAERDRLSNLLREQQEMLLQTLPPMSVQDLLEWP